MASSSLLMACSSPPPPKAPPAERAANQVADIAGRWVTSDEMDNGYSMTIDASGAIDVWIDRGKTGRCEQKGTIKSGSASGVFEVTYTRGECNPQAVGVPIAMKVTSFTGDALTVSVADQSRTYQRGPAPDGAPRGEQAPVQLQK
jgi:hypothetical protein